VTSKIRQAFPFYTSSCFKKGLAVYFKIIIKYTFVEKQVKYIYCGDKNIIFQNLYMSVTGRAREAHLPCLQGKYHLTHKANLSILPALKNIYQFNQGDKDD
jgi:hypothetical protein